MVTRRDWLAAATARLAAAGCEDAAFDARCLLEDFGGLPRGHEADDTPLTADGLAALTTALTISFLALTVRASIFFKRQDTRIAPSLRVWGNSHRI